MILAGISGYIPSEGEHLVLSLQKSNNNLASCSSLAKTTPQSPPGTIMVISDTYSVERSLETFPLDNAANIPTLHVDVRNKIVIQATHSMTVDTEACV